MGNVEEKCTAVAEDRQRLRAALSSSSRTLNAPSIAVARYLHTTSSALRLAAIPAIPPSLYPSYNILISHPMASMITYLASELQEELEEAVKEQCPVVSTGL